MFLKTWCAFRPVLKCTAVNLHKKWKIAENIQKVFENGNELSHDFFDRSLPSGNLHEKRGYLFDETSDLLDKKAAHYDLTDETLISRSQRQKQEYWCNILLNKNILECKIQEEIIKIKNILIIIILLLL